MSEYREKLKSLTDKDRHSFCGEYTYSGYKFSYISRAGNMIYKPTFMLKNVKVYNKETDSWELVSDHLWMNYTKNFKYFFPLEKGDIIYFNGRITDYHSSDGYNVKIERPSKVKVIRNGNELEKNADNILEDKELVKLFEEENADYYKARDTIQAALRIPHYRFAASNYPDIESYIKVYNGWLSQSEYRDKYIEREQVVELFNRINPIETKMDYFNYEENKRVEITDEKLEKEYSEFRRSMGWDDDEYYW